MWNPPQKPSEITEKRLVEAILNEQFPINSSLPGERELSEQLGVTRPTLREALQRLATEGWVDIQQGKPTRIKNYLEEGNLLVLATMTKYQEKLPATFVSNLLVVRKTMAPTYTRLAIENDPDCILKLLENIQTLPDEAGSFTDIDWNLHVQLCKSSQNPIFTMILNGFEQLYQSMGNFYFEFPDTRQASRQFYSELFGCAKNKTPAIAENITKQAMNKSLELWHLHFGGGNHET